MVVQQAQVRVGIEQPLRLVLAVDDGEMWRQLAEDGDRHQRAVHRRLALPGRLDLAPEHDVVAVARQAVAFQQGGGFRRLHDRFDDGRLLPGPDQLRGRARSKEEAQGIDQDRLSRPRFAREQRQPGPERQLQPGHKRDIVDPEQLKHRRATLAEDNTAPAAL